MARGKRRLRDLDGAPPAFLGLRFDAAGRPLRESGTTIIHHIADPAVNRALAAVRDTVRAGSARRIFAWLPPSSYHMTLYDLMLHGRRTPGRWPSTLAPDASDEAADAFVLSAARTLSLEDAPPFRIAPKAIYATEGGLGVAVEGADEHEDARLRAMRDRIAEAVGLTRRLGHLEYGFHITLAYMIAAPTGAEAAILDQAINEAEAKFLAAHPVIELGAPEACRFHDMTAFSREFELT